MPVSERAEKCLSILVVDDDAPVRETMAWMLQDAGHDVHEAAGAAEALIFLAGHRNIDLVISDINMPGISGVELLERARLSWPHIPVILVSGRPPPHAAMPFIAKPFKWQTLATAIAALSEGDRLPEQAAGG